MGQISKQVNEFVESHPIIKHCIKDGVINYSALARKIQKKLEIKNFEAILIAIRRKSEEIQKKRKKVELGIGPVLKKSSLEIKTKILVITLDLGALAKLNELTNEFSREKAYFQIIQGTKHITLIVEEKYSELIQKRLKNNIIKIEKDLVEIVVKSPPKIEKTIGVSSAILSELSDNDINMVENLSCYTDTIIIIEKKDLTKAVELLDKILNK